MLLGLSGGTVPPEAVAAMAPDAVVFAMANPVPEVHPDVAHAAGAAVVATGRSDFPNQINNVLAFPGVFAGALEVRATAHHGGHEARGRRTRWPGVVGRRAPRRPRHPVACSTTRVAPAVAAAVAAAAREDGVARR